MRKELESKMPFSSFSLQTTSSSPSPSPPHHHHHIHKDKLKSCKDFSSFPYSRDLTIQLLLGTLFLVYSRLNYIKHPKQDGATTNCVRHMHYMQSVWGLLHFRDWKRFLCAMCLGANALAELNSVLRWWWCCCCCRLC